MPAGDHEIKCMAWGLNCPIEAEDKIERSHCGERKFSVWPDKNYFFKRAVNDLVFREITCFLPEGMVVVDFSLDNILYFLHEGWAEKLQETGLKVILLADNQENKTHHAGAKSSLPAHAIADGAWNEDAAPAGGRALQSGYRPHHGVRYPQRLPLSILFMQEVRRTQSPAGIALQA